MELLVAGQGTIVVEILCFRAFGYISIKFTIFWSIKLFLQYVDGQYYLYYSYFSYKKHSEVYLHSTLVVVMMGTTTFALQ